MPQIDEDANNENSLNQVYNSNKNQSKESYMKQQSDKFFETDIEYNQKNINLQQNNNFDDNKNNSYLNQGDNTPNFQDVVKQRQIKNFEESMVNIKGKNFQYGSSQDQLFYQQAVENYEKQGINNPKAVLQSLIQESPADQYLNTIKEGGHPYAIFFHCFFKCLSLFCYLFLRLFLPTITVFEIVIILNAFDFWTVKNITGRLLVGLRWWSETMENGEDNWVFECHIKEKTETTINDTVFWGAQTIFVLIWGLFLVINILSIDISTGCTVLFAMQQTGINLYYYYKCSRVQKQRIKKFATEIGTDIAYKLMNQTIKLPINFY